MRNTYKAIIPVLFGTIMFTDAWATDSEPLRTNMETVQAQDLIEQVKVGEAVQLDNVILDGEPNPVTLELERFAVFAPDARIVVHEGGGKKHRAKLPASAYFRGGMQGNPDSIAVLSAGPRGNMRGLVQQGERLWMLGGGAAAGSAVSGLVSRELRQSDSAALLKPFRCDVEKLPAAQRSAKPMATDALAPLPLPSGQHYVVPIGIETDAEFYNLFGSMTAANAYIGDLFAYASTIYLKEINAELLVNYVSLWSGGTSADPWNHNSTSQGLTDFGNYWVAKRTGVKRAAAHFLSGRRLGGGIAWLGALCNKNYGYGYSANIDGRFKISGPAPIWDIIVVAHEIGHNFNSPHSHDFQNIGGNANPIDACYNSQTSRYGTLPGVNSLTGGIPGGGDGTIMSYCHLLSGGYPNISLTFGQNHAYGIEADRESALMSTYVSQIASYFPTCITVAGNKDAQSYTLGVTKIGTGRVLSVPSGIDCGTICSAAYTPGTSVTLSAIPGTGYAFTGWSGGCSGTGNCVVSMAGAQNVTATFATPAKYLLRVTKSGTGTVTSSPAGISCGTTCAASYANGTQVRLTAKPAAYRRFVGWAGACTGTSTCVVTMNSAKSVSATFR